LFLQGYRRFIATSSLITGALSPVMASHLLLPNFPMISPVGSINNIPASQTNMSPFFLNCRTKLSVRFLICRRFFTCFLKLSVCAFSLALHGSAKFAKINVRNKTRKTVKLYKQNFLGTFRIKSRHTKALRLPNFNSKHYWIFEHFFWV
jgi:hypothetical protein